MAAPGTVGSAAGTFTAVAGNQSQKLRCGGQNQIRARPPESGGFRPPSTTTKDVRPIVKSHVNVVVADTRKWEQQAAYLLDTDEHVVSFVKNEQLGFAIPYLHNGQPHDYIPDFLVRLATKSPRTLILETKGYDPLKKIKEQAALRWVAAVNADGRFGEWRYAVASSIEQIELLLAQAAR